MQVCTALPMANITSKIHVLLMCIHSSTPIFNLVLSEIEYIPQGKLEFDFDSDSALGEKGRQNGGS